MTNEKLDRAGPDARESEWMADLFRQHSGAVLAYARRRVEAPEDAEDVVVETFATAWRRRAELPDEPLPWLYGTSANVIAHVFRSQSRRTRLGLRLAAVRPLHESAPDPAEVVASELQGREVMAALDDLSEQDAELLRLWAWEELTPTEIATVIGCEPGTARTRLHRARNRLRQALERRSQSELCGRESDPETNRRFS